jgi:hypothetical protein
MGCIPKIFLICPENFFEMTSPPPPPPPPPPVANISGKTFFDALFFRKVPPKACHPPQLLEASYAPAKYRILFENYLYFHDSRV